MQISTPTLSQRKGKDGHPSYINLKQQKAALACGPLIFTRNTGETLLGPSPENKTPIGAAEAEGIRQGILDRDLARHIGYEVEVAAFARAL